MCKVIAITNHKGGVGKTTTTGNLGIGLANKGKRVLLIDADAQGSLTVSLGYRELDRLEITFKDVLEKTINNKKIVPGCGIITHEEGVDLLPGNIELSGMEVSLINFEGCEKILRTYIEKIKDRYDYILIDGMPFPGMITINSLVAADSVLIPILPEYLAVNGLEFIIMTISKIKRKLNPRLAIEGILLTMVDERTVNARDISRLITENYGNKVKIFEKAIPHSVRAAEISARGISIYRHDPKGTVAEAYRSLTEEVLGCE